jgi:formylglycine-generating enzyme required for sulfatase activity
MAQGGNAFDWLEASFDGVNDSVSENRLVRGGAWMNSSYSLTSHERLYSGAPDTFQNYLGFRVAAVPEPSTYALLLMTGVGAIWMLRRRHSSE